MDMGKNQSQKNKGKVRVKATGIERLKITLYFLIAAATIIYFFNRHGNPMINNILAVIAIVCAVVVTFVRAKQNAIEHMNKQSGKKES